MTDENDNEETEGDEEELTFGDMVEQSMEDKDLSELYEKHDDL